MKKRLMVLALIAAQIIMTAYVGTCADVAYAAGSRRRTDITQPAPSDPEITEPGIPDPGDPAVTDPADPEVTEPADPESPEVTEPSEPGDEDPEDPEVTGPADPAVTDPVITEPDPEFIDPEEEEFTEEEEEEEEEEPEEEEPEDEDWLYDEEADDDLLDDELFDSDREESGWIEPDAAEEDPEQSFFSRTFTAARYGNELIIYRFLVGRLKLNTAAACGILANICCESGFRLNAVGDKGTSYGLCQWHNGRRKNLFYFLYNHGYAADDLSGQLYYLENELVYGGYRDVYDYLLKVEDSAQGARLAARKFCMDYEIPARMAVAVRTRKDLAGNTYYAAYAENREEKTVLVRKAQSIAYPTLGRLSARAFLRDDFAELMEEMAAEAAEQRDGISEEEEEALKNGTYGKQREEAKEDVEADELYEKLKKDQDRAEDDQNDENAAEPNGGKESAAKSPADETAEDDTPQVMPRVLLRMLPHVMLER